MRRSILSCRQVLNSSNNISTTGLRSRRRSTNIGYSRNIFHPHSSSSALATTSTAGPVLFVDRRTRTSSSSSSSSLAYFSSSVEQHLVPPTKDNHEDNHHDHVSVVLDDSSTTNSTNGVHSLKPNESNGNVEDDIMYSISNGYNNKDNINQLASTASESLDRLIDIHENELIISTLSDKRRQELEYDVIHQILYERQLNDIVTSNNDQLIQYAIKNYPWSHERMWNLLLDGSSAYDVNHQQRLHSDNPEYAEYAWNICSMWNATKPQIASLGMYQWGLSILSSQGLYERSLSILRHLKKQQEQESTRTTTMLPDINCYHYGLLACQYHIGTQIDFKNGRKSNRRQQQRRNINSNRRNRKQQQEREPNYVDIQNAAYEIYQEAPYPKPIHFYRTYLSILASNPPQKKIRHQQEEEDVLGQRAIQVLQDMKSSSSLNNNDNMEMDLLCHNLVLKTLARVGNYDASTRILESMIQWKGELRERDDDNDDSTIGRSYDDESSNNNGGQQKTLYPKDSTTTTTTPNLVISFHTVLSAFLEANNIHAAEQAEQVLEIMWKVANLKRRPDYEPTSRAYQQVIAIWVKLGQPQRALSLLEELQNLYKQNKNQNSKFLPDAICYRTVIGGLLKVSDRLSKPGTYDDDDDNDDVIARTTTTTTTKTEIAEQAALVLRNMYDIGHDLDSVAINMCLKCWANAGKTQDVERLLNEISSGLWGGKDNITLDIISYNTIIAAYSKQGNSVRARALLDRLLQHQTEGATKHSSSGSSNSAGTALIKEASSSGESLPKPNTVTFTSVISALGKNGTIESAEEAERLLLRMQELYEDYGYDTRPNIYTYNALLYCWSNIGNPDIQAKIGAPRAELIFRNMQEYLGFDDESGKDQPNVVTYNTIIRAHSHSEFDKVEKLLQEMIYDQKIEPSESTRNTVMTILYRGITHKDKPINMKHDVAHDIAVKYFQNVPAQHRQSPKRHEAARRRSWQQEVS